MAQSVSSCSAIIDTSFNPLNGPPPLAGQCNRTSLYYSEYLLPKESFIPFVTVYNEKTIHKKIRVKFIIVGNANQVIPDNASGHQMVKDMVIWTNNWLNNVIMPTKYNSIYSYLDIYHIPDSRFQLDLKDEDIVFANQQVYNGADSLLHIFVNPPYTGGDNRNGDAFVFSKNYFYSSNNRINLYLNMVQPNLYQLARTFLHEIGHTFTLKHLYNYNGAESCDENSYDYLADVFFGGNDKWCPHDNLSDFNCNPYALVPPYICTNNFMDFFSFENMSPMQIGIMHRESHLGSNSRYIVPAEAPNLHPWLVDKTQNWDFPIRLFSDLVVKSGSTLTISCEVQMPPDSRILVEKNAKLIIDGGKITSYHKHTQWNGIQLEGDNTKQASSEFQGSLELKNGAIIENAFIGIANYTPDNGSQGGGIIKAKNSTIYNCWRSVALNGYGSFTYSPFLNAPNFSLCLFDSMQFIVDDTLIYQFHPSAQAMVTAFDIKDGVFFINSSFKNLIPYNERAQDRRMQGIYTLSSGFYVGDCTFDSLKQGIYHAGYAGFPTRNNRVYSNNFNYITDNITFAADAFGKIRGNTIANMKSYSYNNNNLYLIKFGNGIYLDNSKLTYVNCYNEVDGSSEIALPTYGVIANNTNGYHSGIVDNRFYSLFAGVQTQKDNSELDVLCNDFEENDNGFYINPGLYEAGYILKDQGNGCNSSTQYRANNRFVNNNYDIVSYLTQQWNYYYWNSPIYMPNLAVQNYTGNVDIYNCHEINDMSDPNPKCDLNTACFDIADNIILINAITAYNNLKNNDKQYSLEGQVLYSGIVNGFNVLDDRTGLKDFLEDQDEDRSRKFLLGLYLETGDSYHLNQTLNALTVSKEEMLAYTTYYQMLLQQKTEGRFAIDLTYAEESTLRDLAESEYDIAFYAKSLLEWAKDETWHHEIEEPALLPMAYSMDQEESFLSKRSLGEAFPNPTGGLTTIISTLMSEDLDLRPQLVIRDMQGIVKARFDLKEIYNETKVDTRTWQSGVYLYSLELNQQIIQTKKLSIQK